MDLLYLILLLLINAVGVFLVTMSLPGTWLIVFATAGVAWWQGEDSLFGWVSLSIVIGLALLGEVLELAAGALGAKKAGGTAWGAVGALIGGVAGGILGTFLIPIPVVGSILGAALGAFGGAILGEVVAGRGVEASLASGRGAFGGRLMGTLYKLVIAVLMWTVVAFAAFL
jgi:uncharacterized protein YqgC (DUF456 family)